VVSCIHRGEQVSPELCLAIVTGIGGQARLSGLAAMLSQQPGMHTSMPQKHTHTHVLSSMLHSTAEHSAATVLLHVLLLLPGVSHMCCTISPCGDSARRTRGLNLPCCNGAVLLPACLQRSLDTCSCQPDLLSCLSCCANRPPTNFAKEMEAKQLCVACIEPQRCTV
jgi:hypothetical protein